MSAQEPAVTSPLASTSNELASRRTGMAFQRTRLAADRTLMAVIRTSLSLLSFGFTIHKVFDQLKDTGMIAHAPLCLTCCTLDLLPNVSSREYSKRTSVAGNVALHPSSHVTRLTVHGMAICNEHRVV